MASYGSLGADATTPLKGYNAVAEAEDSTPVASGGNAEEPAALSSPRTISRAVVIDVLEKRRHRADQCRSVPVSVALYIFYIVCMMTHVLVLPGYDFESNLVNSIIYAGDGFAPYTVGDWYSWMQESFIPNVLPDTDVNGNTIPPEQRGYFAQFGLIVGGVRIVQTRAVETNCTGLAPAVQAVYAKQCHDMSKYSNDPYGDAATADALGVLSAFQPVPPQSSDGHVPSGAMEFEYYLNVENDTQVNIDTVAGLSAAGWIDAATREVRVQLAVLNGESGMWGRVEFVATFTRGSRVATSASAISLPVNPYSYGRGYLYLFDAIIILYWIYLFMGTLRRIYTTFRTTPGCFNKIAALFSYWRILDTVVSCSLLAVIVSWGVTCTRLGNIRSSLADVANPSPAAYAGGPTDLQNRINSAAFSYYCFKNAASLTLMVLTARLYKYFAFQPRLGVMTATFERAFSDAMHFVFLFGLLLVMYGVWGHFQFGAQAPDWADPSILATTVMRFAMYDYDLIAMENQYRLLADIFYVTFMFSITNLVLWMFLAILLENYTEVRMESHLGPSAWQEAAAYFSTLPQTFGVVRWLRGRRFGSPYSSSKSACCPGSSSSSPASGTPLLKEATIAISPSAHERGAASISSSGTAGVTAASQISLAELTWREILDAVQHHPSLRGKEQIAPKDLTFALGVSESEASLLVSDLTTAGKIVAGELTPDDTDVTAGVLYGALSPMQLAKVASASEEKEAKAIATADDSEGGGAAATGAHKGAGAAQVSAASVQQLTSVIAQLSAQVAALQQAVSAQAASRTGTEGNQVTFTGTF